MPRHILIVKMEETYCNYKCNKNAIANKEDLCWKKDTNRLLFALVGRLEYYEKFKAKGFDVNMCKAFDDHYKAGERKGEKRGERRGKQWG